MGSEALPKRCRHQFDTFMVSFNTGTGVKLHPLKWVLRRYQKGVRISLTPLWCHQKPPKESSRHAKGVRLTPFWQRLRTQNLTPIKVSIETFYILSVGLHCNQRTCICSSIVSIYSLKQNVKTRLRVHDQNKHDYTELSIRFQHRTLKL